MHLTVQQLTIGLAVLCAASAASADAKRGEAKAQLCLACHKPTYPWNPLLEGQPASYLAASMAAFKAGVRQEPAMNANMASLTQQDMQDIADYFSAKPLPPRAQALDAAKVQKGRAIAEEMKCASCHQTSYKGTSNIPRLAGQHYKYLQIQLEAFSQSRRKGHSAAALPAGPESIEAVTQYLASVE